MSISPRLLLLPAIVILALDVAGSARADVCWQREVAHIDKRTGEVTYRNRAVPCPDDRPGNREGVCWQREIERIDPKTGRVTYRNRAVPCREVP